MSISADTLMDEMELSDSAVPAKPVADKVGRFTLDGDAGLERHLANICGQVLEKVQTIVPSDTLAGLLLGGGYGRGEGGVLRTSSGDLPYNDLEFFVLCWGNGYLAERKYREPLHHLGEDLSPEAGLEVEFKILGLEKLRRGPVTMFYYDLVMGHKLLLGDQSLLAMCDHQQVAKNIPLHEAARLLLNRCSGLLFSAEKLRHEELTEEDKDFIGRNIAKAQLGFGDVFLTAHGLYHWSCRERHRRLSCMKGAEAPYWFDEIRRQHRDGLHFKLHPERCQLPKGELLAMHAEISDLGQLLWLWLEERRLGWDFSTPRDYALNRTPKCPETNPLRNVLVNLKIFGKRAPLGLKATRYPRERLFHALALLLWDPSISRDVPARNRLREELNTDGSTFSEWVTAYKSLWQYLN